MKKDVFMPADILLPDGIPMEKWSVIACDQFSSEREYWDRVRTKVGDNPSTLDMIIPEAFLGQNEAEAGEKIISVMERYIGNGIFKEIKNSFIYVERTLSDGRVRRGLVGAADLEEYEFSGGKAAILASEGTVLDRLPPRVRVRRSAQLELPHIMAFIDDKEKTVIEPIAGKRDMFPLLYDFELMEGGGRISGYQVCGEAADEILKAMRALRAKNRTVLAMGDGNHSLAAAKVYWDEAGHYLSPKDQETHPARFALLEVNNIYDPAVSFKAIHRVLFGVVPGKFVNALESAMPSGDDYKLRWVSSGGGGEIGVCAERIGDMLTALQAFIDDYANKTGCTVDYIHGADTAETLSSAPGRVGLILPSMDKSDFFKTVTKSGIFPKKSFSVGHARDKRYYLECRKIKP